MLENDETMGKELVEHLRGAGIMVSASTALCIRKQLGWTSLGVAYCHAATQKCQQGKENGICPSLFTEQGQIPRCDLV